MRTILLFGLAVALAGPAAAHDFWVQPRAFWLDQAGPAAEVPATLQVGHGPFRQRSPIPARRILALRSFGPSGTVDQRGGLKLGGPDADIELTLPGAGLHVVALETNFAASNLPAIRFNDYLKAEGLTPAIDWRERTGAGDQPGREIYSRCAKAMVEVGEPGPAPEPQATAPTGLALEIVPERDPYRLALPAALPVQVLYHGEPLAGALVKLTDLDADEKPVDTRRTDASGRAAFTIPRRGSWLLNVIWTQPIPANREADFVTIFSSLSFGYPGASS